MALLYVLEVHGVTVMMLANLNVTGEVSEFSKLQPSMFDIGRYPEGSYEYHEALPRILG